MIFYTILRKLACSLKKLRFYKTALNIYNIRVELEDSYNV